MTTKLHLQPDELIEATGYRQKSCQLAWLKLHKVPHKVSAFGKPVVVRSVYEASHEQKKRARASQPNWPTTQT